MAGVGVVFGYGVCVLFGCGRGCCLCVVCVSCVCCLCVVCVFCVCCLCVVCVLLFLDVFARWVVVDVAGCC